MFDIGWGELVVIGIVALIAIGPKELPTVLRTLGQYMAKIRRMSAEFQGQFQEALREAEVAELKQQAESLKSTVTDFAKIDPLADTPKPPDPIAETAAAPSGDAPPPPEVQTAASEPVAETTVPTAEAASPPPIDVPLPEPVPPVTNADFTSAEPAAAETEEPQKRAGSGP
ncbi:MAG TPA: Sec-independent protein translocase protein TatB [Pseudolabrys sp.]|jgi:sec-independent protein translocase protein TatB